MVRTIDGAARRRDVAEAVWRLLERDGPAAASVRGVAQEAGLSTGSVRHFFGTQAELHLFALTTLSERVTERIGRAAAEPDVRRRVVAMLAELVPLRDDTERELRVWWEFVRMSGTEPGLRAVIVSQADQIRAFLAQVVRELAELGLTPPAVDAGSCVDRLAALVDGLTFQLLVTPESIDRARAKRVLRDAVLGTSPMR